MHDVPSTPNQDQLREGAERWLREFAEQLDQLILLDPSFQAFGTTHHLYRLSPPLAEEDVSALELALGVTLPADYRHFIRHLGAAGAGPGYGLQRIALIGDDQVVPSVVPNDPHLHDFYETALELSVDDPSLQAPFGLKESLLPDENDEDGIVQEDAPDGSDDGIVSLADYGCGITARLCLSGDASGTIWVDDRPNSGSVALISDWVSVFEVHLPHVDDDIEGNSFKDWYEHWLRSVRREANNPNPNVTVMGIPGRDPPPHPHSQLRTLREKRASALAEAQAREARQRARESRRAAKKTEAQRRSAQLLSQHLDAKDGTRLDGDCALCGKHGQLRVCFDRLTLCPDCYFEW